MLGRSKSDLPWDKLQATVVIPQAGIISAHRPSAGPPTARLRYLGLLHLLPAPLHNAPPPTRKASSGHQLGACETISCCHESPLPAMSSATAASPTSHHPAPSASHP